MPPLLLVVTVGPFEEGAPLDPDLDPNLDRNLDPNLDPNPALDVGQDRNATDAVANLNSALADAKGQLAVMEDMLLKASADADKELHAKVRHGTRAQPPSTQPQPAPQRTHCSMGARATKGTRQSSH